MTRRMLDSAIFANEKFGTMPPMARLLAIGIINKADDQGRGKANPIYLRSQIFPYDEVAATQVSEWLAMVASNETILVYQVDGKDYYQVLNWWSYQSHQFAVPSQYPKPDGWKDRIRKNLSRGVIVTCNWITADGKRSPDTCDEHGLLLQVDYQSSNQVDGSTYDQEGDQLDYQDDNHLDDQVDDEMDIQVDNQVDYRNVQIASTRSRSRSRLQSSSRLQSNSSSSASSESVLVDPDFVRTLDVWQKTFANTPWEAMPPNEKQINKWLAYSGLDVLCYMIVQSQDKGKPAAWIWQCYENWRQDGEVAHFIQKEADKAKLGAKNGTDPAKPKAVKMVPIEDPITKEIREVPA